MHYTTKKKTSAPAQRAALLAFALPMIWSATAGAQTEASRRQQEQQTAESREREAAGRRVAASYGVMLDEISVYADRGPQPFLQQTQNVTVVGRKQLDERQVHDVQDLVRYEPGVTVSKTTSSVDPFGNLVGFTIRGVSNNRVMMLVDGARVIESIVDGNRDFVGIGNLKTVEIIRGPAGVLYGADALGGLVAFVTKDPEDYLKGRNFGGQVDTGYDSYDRTWSPPPPSAGASGRRCSARRIAPTMKASWATRIRTAASGRARATRKPFAATSSIRSTARSMTSSASWCGIRTPSTRSSSSPSTTRATGRSISAPTSACRPAASAT